MKVVIFPTAKHVARKDARASGMTRKAMAAAARRRVGTQVLTRRKFNQITSQLTQEKHEQWHRLSQEQKAEAMLDYRRHRAMETQA